MFECGDCGKAFPAGWAARENHCLATGHSRPYYECDNCGRQFGSEMARLSHMRAKNHFAWECRICDETWPTEEELDEHYIDDHNWCESCDRYFQNANNLRAHLNSRIHRGRDICCPFCSAEFTTATGMVHHLERARCPRAPSINRDEIYRLVRRKDPSGVISKKLIGWEGEADVQYEAGPRSWNGYAYECYLCSKGFRSLPALNQHLNSGTHQRDLYHCPNLACRANFKTLAAIINHLESESCGAVRFDTVQQRIGDIVSGNRLISFA